MASIVYGLMRHGLRPPVYYRRHWLLQREFDDGAGTSASESKVGFGHRAPAFR
jgi:hypothetical protein